MDIRPYARENTQPIQTAASTATLLFGDRNEAECKQPGKDVGSCKPMNTARAEQQHHDSCGSKNVRAQRKRQTRGSPHRNCNSECRQQCDTCQSCLGVSSAENSIG